MSIKRKNRFNNLFVCFLLVFLALGQLGYSQLTAIDTNVQSDILHKRVNYTVCLPSDYEKSDLKFPAIFLFHGLTGQGSDWIKKGNIVHTVDSLRELGKLPPVILVMPDAENSYYVNNYDSSYRYEDFLMKEFVPLIDSVYPVLPGRENHILMGLSMGGYGVVVQGIKHANVFGTVIAFSAAVRNDSILESLSDQRYAFYFNSVFGPATTPESRITRRWRNNSPYYLVDSLSAKQLRHITWYMECGTEDYLLPANLALDKIFNQYDIPHELVLRPGNHNWEFWRPAIAHALIYISPLLSRD